jgi:adenosylcobinamide-phosphate synthase
VRNAFYIPTTLIVAALALDVALGDPSWMPHPVRLIGRVITWGEARLWTGFAHSDSWRGAALTIAVVAVSTAATWAIIAIASAADRWFGGAIAVLIAWTTLALKGLDRTGGEVERKLAAGRADLARAEISALVGRDPAALDTDGMVLATIESVAENCSDGIIAPLLYLFVAGPAAAIAYKAINTLDSMIGYRNERFLYFGRAAARIDDAANFVPARLTAFCLAAAAAGLLGRGAQAMRACRTDARKHASPNAGYPEATMAGALGVELGGDVVYAGEIEHRTHLGLAERSPSISDIATARRLMRMAVAIGFCALALTRYVVAGC